MGWSACKLEGITICDHVQYPLRQCWKRPPHIFFVALSGRSVPKRSFLNKLGSRPHSSKHLRLEHQMQHHCMNGGYCLTSWHVCFLCDVGSSVALPTRETMSTTFTHEQLMFHHQQKRGDVIPWSGIRLNRGSTRTTRSCHGLLGRMEHVSGGW